MKWPVKYLFWCLLFGKNERKPVDAFDGVGQLIAYSTNHRRQLFQSRLELHLGLKDKLKSQ